MTAPRVAVLMAVHNEGRFLGAAIESLLGQTWRDFELLIIDDASTDRSREIVASYRDPRIRLIVNETNLGLTRSLNRGLSMTRSEYVARQDGDDLSFPTRLAKQVAHLDAHPDVAVIGTQVYSIDAAGRRMRRVEWWNAQWRRPVGRLAMDWYRMFDTPFVHSSVMFRRAAVEAAGGYDERYPLNQDAELWMRLARIDRIDNLDEVLVGFRFHPGSMTEDPARREREGYLQLKIDLLHTLLREGLRRDDLPRRWAELWQGATSPDDVRELIDVLERCFARFVELHPEARGDRDIARHRASMLARLAARVASTDRRFAFSLVRRMFPLDAKSARSFLPRIALLAFGERALTAWRIAQRRRAA